MLLLKNYTFLAFFVKENLEKCSLFTEKGNIYGGSLCLSIDQI